MGEKDHDLYSKSLPLAAQNKLNQKTAQESELGITQEYKGNRKIWDSASGRKQFKEESFGDKKVIKDKITGEDIHKSQTAAQNKYHMRDASGDKKSAAHAKHEAETDHIISLKELHGRTKDNPFLSDNDLKEIANNQKTNYRLLPKSFNASKGERSDYEVALDLESGLPLAGRTELFLERTRSEILVSADIAIHTVQNAGSIFLEGAKNTLAASAIPLAIQGVKDLVHVANGDMELKDAVDDIGKMGLSIAASGGTARLATYSLSFALDKSNNEILKNFAKSNQIGTVIIVGSIVARAVGKYLDGEVDAEGFFDEISESGLNLITGMIASHVVDGLLVGTAASGIVVAAAPMLAAMIVSAACSEIYAQCKLLSQEKKDNQEIRQIANAASAAIQTQQEEIRRIMDDNHEQWANEMTEIFQIVAEGITESSPSQINQGLRRLAASYNKQVSLYDSGATLIDDVLSARNSEKGFHLLF